MSDPLSEAEIAALLEVPEIRVIVERCRDNLLATLAPAGLREWWESLTHEEMWEAFLIEKSNADALATPSSTPDVENKP